MKRLLILFSAIIISITAFAQEEVQLDPDPTVQRNQIIMACVSKHYKALETEYNIKYQMIEISISELLTKMDSIRLHSSVREDRVAMNMLAQIESRMEEDSTIDWNKQKEFWENKLNKINPVEQRLSINEIMNPYGWVIEHHYVLTSESGLEAEYYEPIFLRADGRVVDYPF